MIIERLKKKSSKSVTFCHRLKLKFKLQDYQTKAVEAVADCFRGQPDVSGAPYRIDPGADVVVYAKLPRGFHIPSHGGKLQPLLGHYFQRSKGRV